VNFFSTVAESQRYGNGSSKGICVWIKLQSAEINEICGEVAGEEIH